MVSSTSAPPSVRGALRPRVETHPPYVDTFGDIASELSRRAGQALDRWQQDGLGLMLAFRADGKWACFEYCEWVSRQNGKGTCLEARVIAGFLLLGERLILWSAHEYKTSMEAFRRVKRLLVGLGELVNDNLIRIPDPAGDIFVKVSNTNGDEGFERLDTEQRIKFVARSKGSGRGFTGDLIILDEAFALVAQQIEALFFTLSAVENPQIIYTSSPPLTSDTGEIMFNLRHRGDPTAPRADDDPPWSQDDSLGYRDWGLAGDLDSIDELDLTDPQLAAASNPALGIRISLETVARERRSMGRVGFARERLGIWPKRVAIGAGVISEELWRTLRDPEADRPADVTFALHVNRARTYAAVLYAGRRHDGRIQVGIADFRPGTAWTVARMVELKQKWNPLAIAVDTKSESLLLDLDKAGIRPSVDPDDPKRGDLIVPGAADVAAAYGLFVDAARHDQLRHRDEPPMNTAIAGADIRKLAGGSTWDDGSAVEVAPLIAATLALWAFEARAHLVTAEYDPLANIY